jgi:serine/threonine-protein kinase
VSDQYSIDLTDTDEWGEFDREKQTLPALSNGYFIDALPLSTRINDFYISNKLGQGGMGFVYRAVRAETRDVFALKFFPHNYGEHLDYDPFEREVRLHSRVRHPNVAQLVDCGEIEGRKYLVMEYVPGQSLFTAVNRREVTSLDVLKIMKQTASALKEVHAQDVVHRDVKPDNIMLTPTNDVKLIDFGIAIDPREPDDTSDAELFGSLGYIAPEQAYGQLVDGRTDQWALAMTWYCTLACEEPQGSSAKELIQWRPKVPLSSLEQSIPVAWDDVWKIMIDDRRSQRFETMHQVEQELDLLVAEYRPVPASMFARGFSFMNPFTRARK